MEAPRWVRDLQSQETYKVCVDYSQKNPSWASIFYDLFMCLECSASTAASASTSPSLDPSPWTRGNACFRREPDRS
ncbi:hypothetical protein PIB30_088939 [Stylosanthes scabra]|uniref:Arf-GAP domain-containing protein n=1 Tax=Stylosanthes scabra TaxID=79078 RepID=A0ABU6VSB0_9FABA|nr:hypothetical protein [Stylosanthes scabra]